MPPRRARASRCRSRWARRHDCRWSPPSGSRSAHEQMMQQESTAAPRPDTATRPRRRPPGGRPAALDEHDGRRGRLQQPLLDLGQPRVAARHVQRGHHQGERLLLAPLSGAEPRHRLGLPRIHEQLEPANALEGHDAACARARVPRPASASSSSRGPHTGQAFGCAWKRRSCRVLVLRGQSAHIANAAHGRAARGRRGCPR